MNDDKPGPTAAQDGAAVQPGQPGAQPPAGAGPDAKPEQPAKEEGKPDELSPEELRLMADTMPGDGPGDD